MTDAPSPDEPPSGTAAKPDAALPPVVVKKYANRRLYNTETSSYITLDSLAGMIRAGRDFAVYDAKTGEDITRSVLTQIIVEEESKGSAMLPTTFLRQLIGFYGGNLQGVVPRYLEHTMESFARQQQQMRTMVERTLGSFLPTGVEEMGRQNMALFERAFSMWNPFHQARGEDEHGTVAHAAPEPATSAPSGQAEMDQLRLHIEALQRQLAAAQAASIPTTLPKPPEQHPEQPTDKPESPPAAAVQSPSSAPPGTIPPNVARDPVEPAKPGKRPARSSAA